MNLYSTIILVALMAAFLLELVSEMLNLRALKGKLPPEFEEVYDADMLDVKTDPYDAQLFVNEGS